MLLIQLVWVHIKRLSVPPGGRLCLVNTSVGTDRKDLLAARQTDRSRTMKAGRDEPLLFLSGPQTIDHSRLNRTGTKCGCGVRSGPVHFTPPFDLHPRRPKTHYPPLASQQLKAESANQSAGAEKPIHPQKGKPRPSCVSCWHPIGCLLRGKKTKQIQKEEQ